MKETQILVKIIVLVVGFLLALVFILMSYIDGDIAAFGRRSRGSHDVTDNPSGFWFSFLAWGGLLLFLFGALIVDIVKSIKKINEKEL